LGATFTVIQNSCINEIGKTPYIVGSKTTEMERSAAQEYILLWDLRHGVRTKAISMREGVCEARVRLGVARARGQERSCPTQEAIRPPRLVPLFPLVPFPSQAPCGHLSIDSSGFGPLLHGLATVPVWTTTLR
jgi:hypothetical protein